MLPIVFTSCSLGSNKEGFYLVKYVAKAALIFSHIAMCRQMSTLFPSISLCISTTYHFSNTYGIP